MKIRAAVLTVLTVLLIGFPILSQPEESFQARITPLTIANDPETPVVKVLTVIEDGKTLVRLRNGFHRTVMLKGVFVVSNGTKASLLEDAEELLPADTRYFDVSSHLMHCFTPSTSARQEKNIKIQLSVEPEPKGQPQELFYRVCFEGGIFTKFEKSQKQAS